MIQIKTSLIWLQHIIKMVAWALNWKKEIKNMKIKITCALCKMNLTKCNIEAYKQNYYMIISVTYLKLSTIVIHSNSFIGTLNLKTSWLIIMMKLFSLILELVLILIQLILIIQIKKLNREVRNRSHLMLLSQEHKFFIHQKCGKKKEWLLKKKKNFHGKKRCL